MFRVKQRLRLNYQHRTSLSRLGATTRVQIRQPDLTPIRHQDLFPRPQNRHSPACSLCVLFSKPQLISWLEVASGSPDSSSLLLDGCMRNVIAAKPRLNADWPPAGHPVISVISLSRVTPSYRKRIYHIDISPSTS